MSAKHSISAFIKSPLVPIFIIGFALVLGVMLVREWIASPVKMECSYPFSYYDIKSDQDVTLTRGIFRTYRDGISSGHLTFIGSLSHFSEGELTAPPVPLNRELHFALSIQGSNVHMTVKSHGRRLGDQSNDQQVKNYVFPQISGGEVGSSTLYLLQGKVLSTGTETVARTVCVD